NEFSAESHGTKINVLSIKIKSFLDEKKRWVVTTFAGTNGSRLTAFSAFSSLNKRAGMTAYCLAFATVPGFKK
ncbi:MAG: hypothetical protein ACKVQC_08170, partial [Elusimicrobiota bacterium]